MKTYLSLTKIPFLRKSYASKFLAVAFLGIHIPLIGISILLFSSSNLLSSTQIAIITLTLTLVATAATLPVINGLLYPIKLAKNILAEYEKNATIRQVPNTYDDEVGILFEQINKTLHHNSNLISQKSTIIDLMSHDFRTPLHHISQLCSLSTTTTGKEQEEYLTLIEIETQKLLTLMEEILKTLRDADNKSRTFPIHILLSECLSELAITAESKKVQFKTRIDDNVIINANSVLLKQAIKNILSNAIKFSHPNQHIDITAKCAENKTSIIITDYGIGIEKINETELFKRFTSMSKSGTANESSTGLGLNITKTIVEKMGGQIGASSPGLGKGTTFIITLPSSIITT